ncbi:MAG: flagellar motor switch protein FliN [Gammaproteobacteria bacterium]
MNDTTDTTDSPNTDDATDDWAAAMAEQTAAEAIATDEVPADPSPAQFQDLQDDGQGPANEDSNLDVILDIPVSIAMEIGRTQISIRNLLQLNQGSVVELDRLAGEPMDVLVNGTLVAHGEVVVVNEKFGIRLTDVVSPAERVKKLK